MAQRTAVTRRWLTRRTHIANLLRVASNSPLGYSNDTLAVLPRTPTYCPAMELFSVAERNTEAWVFVLLLLSSGSIIATLV